jgi:uncharacterized protein YndB with AHSA1/START domain
MNIGKVLPSIAAAVLLFHASPLNSQTTSTARRPAESARPNSPRQTLANDAYAKLVGNSSFITPAGERILRHEVVVDASLEDVWKALTTSEGLESFLAPVVYIELKTGGKFESNYQVGAKLGDPGTIHNQVLNYIPMEMFSIKVNLTEQFPQQAREAGTLFAVLTLQNLGSGRVKVTESMLGWGQGEEWDKTYRFFDSGNAYTLGQLYRRFKEGPRRWNNNPSKLCSGRRR